MERPLISPAEVVRYLYLRFASAHQEVLGALFLNQSNRLLGETAIGRGTIDRISVEPRQTIAEALRRGATGIVLFHNHPSGDPSPSAEDFDFTRRVTHAAALFEIRIVDHLVIGSKSRFVSLLDRRPDVFRT